MPFERGCQLVQLLINMQLGPEELTPGPADMCRWIPDDEKKKLETS